MIFVKEYKKVLFFILFFILGSFIMVYTVGLRSISHAGWFDQQKAKDFVDLYFVSHAQDLDTSFIFKGSHRVQQFKNDVLNTSYKRVGFDFDKISFKSIYKENAEMNTFAASAKYDIFSKPSGDIVFIEKNETRPHWEVLIEQGNERVIPKDMIIFSDYVLVAYQSEIFLFDIRSRKIIYSIEFSGKIENKMLMEKDNLFFVFSDFKNNEKHLVSLNLTERKINWMSLNFQESSKISELAVSREAVFLTNEKNKAYAYVKSTGEFLWEKEITLVDSPLSYPLLVSDKLILKSARKIFALNSQTGELLWSVLVDGSLIGDLALHKYQKTVFINSEKGLYKFDSETGNKLSFLRRKTDIGMQKTQPVLVENNQGVFIFQECASSKLCVYRYEKIQPVNLYEFKANIEDMFVDTNRILVTLEDGTYYQIKN